MTEISDPKWDQWAFEIGTLLRNAASAAQSEDWLVAVALLNEARAAIFEAERNVVYRARSQRVRWSAIAGAVGLSGTGVYRRYVPQPPRVKGRPTLGIDE